MNPTQAELIRCVEASLDEHVAPQLRDEMARSQLLTIRYLLDQLRLRVEFEAPALAEYELDARQTLKQVRSLLAGSADPAVSALVARIDRLLTGPVPTGPAAYAAASLESRTRELRGHLDDAVRALGLGSDQAPAVEARRLLHACLARHLDREARWLSAGYGAPRR